jgi:hypothetical protein
LVEIEEKWNTKDLYDALDVITLLDEVEGK